jgi:hypothetical protein
MIRFYQLLKGLLAVILAITFLIYTTNKTGMFVLGDAGVY